MVRPTHSRPDGRFGDLIIEVARGEQAAGWMRGTAVRVAARLAAEPGLRGLLVVVEPKMTDARIGREVEELRGVLRPEIASRLFVASFRGGHLSPSPPGLGPELDGVVQGLVERPAPVRRARRGTSGSSVLQVLVHHWLRGSPPVAIGALMRATGLSYPSVAAGLARLAHVTRRGKGRSVELVRFPREEWDLLVASSDTVRETVRFADRSGKPRAVESLVRRLVALGRDDIAIGGILGATHHLPTLDVVGTPRLDLSVHAPGGVPDVEFVARLDAGLTQTERRDEPAALVLHVVRRHDPLFDPGRSGRTWADASECLLDLQEAGLHAQAQQFLRELAARHGRRP